MCSARALSPSTGQARTLSRAPTSSHLSKPPGDSALHPQGISETSLSLWHFVPSPQVLQGWGESRKQSIDVRTSHPPAVTLGTPLNSSYTPNFTFKGTACPAYKMIR